MANHPEVRRRPISIHDINGIGDFITPTGDLRTLPSGWPDPDPRLAGLDGFFRETCSPPGVPPRQLTREQINEIGRKYETEYR